MELAVLLATHPEILSAGKSVEAARQDVRESKSRFLPNIVLSGDGGYEYTDSPSRRISPGSPLSTGRSRMSLSVNENVFDGFRDTNRLKIAGLNVGIAESRREATVQRLLFQGAKAYLDVLRSSRQVELSRDDEVTIRQQLRLEDERVRRGSGIGVDVLLAKARLQVSKERRVAFEGQQRQALDRYNRLFGHLADPGKLREPVPPLDLIPETIVDATIVALKENPNLDSSARTVAVRGLEKAVAAADYYPRLDLVARGNREDNVDGIEGIRRDWSVLLEARWELYSGSRTQARETRAKIRHSSSKDDNAAAERQIEEDVRQSWNALASARERLELLENAVTIAGEVFDARDKLRRAGRGSTINVLDAQQEVNNARIGLTDARYDALTATYRLLAALGRLSPERLQLPEVGAE